MGIVEAAEALKAGETIVRIGWDGVKLRATQLESGEYQVCAVGAVPKDMIALLTADYTIEEVDA